MLKPINQVLTFILEIAMLCVFAYYGYSRNTNTVTGYVSAFALVAIAIILWAIFAAPKSTRRLKMPYIVVFRAMMFLLAAFFLYQTGHQTIAAAMAIMAVVTQTASLFTEK